MSSAKRRTARSAMRAAADLSPDLVLLDIQLPDLDGFEVATRSDGRRRLAHRRADLQPRRRRLRHPGRPQRRPRLHPQGRPLRRSPGGPAQVISLRRALIGLGIAGLRRDRASAWRLILSSNHVSDAGSCARAGGFVAVAWICTGLSPGCRRPHHPLRAADDGHGLSLVSGALSAARSSLVFTLSAGPRLDLHRHGVAPAAGDHPERRGRALGTDRPDRCIRGDDHPARSRRSCSSSRRSPTATTAPTTHSRSTPATSRWPKPS